MVFALAIVPNFILTVTLIVYVVLMNDNSDWDQGLLTSIRNQSKDK